MPRPIDIRQTTHSRLVEAYTESKKRLDRYVAEIDQYRTLFMELAKFFSRTNLAAFANQRDEINHLPPAGRVRRLTEEIAKEFEKKNLLARKLRELGVDVEEDKGFPFSSGPPPV